MTAFGTKAPEAVLGVAYAKSDRPWGRAPEAAVGVDVLGRMPVVADGFVHLRVSVAHVAGPDIGGVLCGHAVLGLHLRHPAATRRGHECRQHGGMARPSTSLVEVASLQRTPSRFSFSVQPPATEVL